MQITDPIADLLTRIRNAGNAVDSLHGIRINAIDNDKVRLKLCISAKLRFNRM